LICVHLWLKSLFSVLSATAWIAAPLAAQPANEAAPRERPMVLRAHAIKTWEAEPRNQMPEMGGRGMDGSLAKHFAPPNLVRPWARLSPATTVEAGKVICIT
jgi:hypothetical protein